MSRELLMYEGQLSLCRCDAERVERLAVCPVPLPDLWCWSDDRAHDLVVDQQRKRVTTFRLAGDHFERTMSPLALPRGVVAHCVAMKGPQPYIGASSVWVPNAESGWTQTKMPEFALGEGIALKRAVFLGDVLCVLSESSGAEPCAVLNWIDLTAAPLPLPAFKERRAHRPTLREEEISELAEASELVAASGGDGVYVCGRSRGGAHTVAWRPIGSLED